VLERAHLVRLQYPEGIALHLVLQLERWEDQCPITPFAPCRRAVVEIRLPFLSFASSDRLFLRGVGNAGRFLVLAIWQCLVPRLGSGTPNVSCFFCT
jgi:hypothetical protein